MEPIHPEAHPKFKQEVRIVSGPFADLKFQVEDWWDRSAGYSWKEGVKKRVPICLLYAVRVQNESLHPDDEVVVGEVGGHRLLLHHSQLE